MRTVTLLPRLSEKTYRLSQETNTYVFDVPVDSTKHQIKQAVESQFKVAVTSVNTQKKTGKAKRSLRRRVQPTIGRKATTKRAYVSLKQGDKIAMFEEG